MRRKRQKGWMGKGSEKNESMASSKKHRKKIQQQQDGEEIILKRYREDRPCRGSF